MIQEKTKKKHSLKPGIQNLSMWATARPPHQDPAGRSHPHSETGARQEPPAWEQVNAFRF